MGKILSGVVAGAIALSPAAVLACRGNSLIPQHGQAGQFQVLLVEVTGTHLTDYEWYRAANLGLSPWPKAPNGEPVLYLTSSTPQFVVNTIVRRTNRGASAPLREFKLSGCGIRIPTLKEAGLIFIAPDGNVGSLWASQDPQYNLWLKELKLGTSDEP